ncbi:LysR family transcriptional regulator [Paraburkholderia sp. ZP32-5]|uniref:LysR family transcriptional regulator n=1 Tax=Paraburkholderia sp. ZP32-5 TaxID=2883245 RepID=UPI001F364DD3|nr:LysR family transcriptional regulator [Paraburkholderia sp. ZP32-5]
MASGLSDIGNVTIKQLRAFVVVVQEKTFTSAANVLHVTQGAVSLLVNELEKELGVRLLDRTPRVVELTEAGAEFHPTALRLLHELNAAIADTRGLSNLRRGRVSVAASPLLSALMLPSIVAAYQRNYPDISIVLRDVASGEVRKMVEDAGAELGVGSPEGPGDLLTAEVIQQDDVLLIVPRDHVLCHYPRLSWSDIAGFPLIALTMKNATRLLVDECADKEGVRLNPQYEVSHVGTAVGMVAAGSGIAFVPGYASKIVDTSLVAIRKLDNLVTARPIALLYRRNRSLGPAAQTFRDFLLDWTRAENQLDRLQ